MQSRQRRLQCGVSSTFDSSRWIKLAKGLDDFRYGPPSPYAGRILPASPAIIHDEVIDTLSITPDYSPSIESIIPVGVRSSIKFVSKISLSIPTGDQSVSTRTSTQPKIHSRFKQKKHVQSIEQKLKENPLILFPYLESDIPHEVFEKLMSILGTTPESGSTESVTSVASGTELKMSESKIKLMQSRKLFSRKNVEKKTVNRGTASAQAVEEAARHILKGGDANIDTLPRSVADEFRKMNEEKAESTGSVLGQRRNVGMDPYRSFLKRINYSGERSKKKVKKFDVKPTEESETNVRQVAEDFCNWMQTIGGEDAKFTMDVDKVLTLFAMNAELESLQATSNVLDEFPLSQDEADSLKKAKPSMTSRLSAKPTLTLPKTKMANEKEIGSKKFQEYRYGAWYLDINQWKKLKPGEILEDPEEMAIREKQEANRCSDELDTQLADLHTYHTFTKFIRRNNLKLPSFLQYVASPVSVENVFGKELPPGK